MVPIAPEMTFWGHLGELRSLLIKAGVAFGVSLGGALLVLGHLVALLSKPLAEQPLVFLTPFGPFGFQMRIAGTAAILLSLGPWMVLIVNFVSPALSRQTRTLTWLFVFVSLALSCLALAITYEWVLPWSLRALEYAAVPGSELLLTADAYLDLFLMEAAFLGVILQLPILLAVLTMWGVLSPTWLKRRRALLYLLLTALVALVTPTTDILSLSIALLPAALSLELGLLIAGVVHKGKTPKSIEGLQ